MKKNLKYFIIGALVLGVIGLLFIYQTHKSVDQELTEEDLELQKILQEQSKESSTVVESAEPVSVTTEKQSEEVENTTSEVVEELEENVIIEEPDVETSKETNTGSTSPILKEGEFNPDAKDSDAFHRGWGGISIVSFEGKNKVVLAEDFKVTNGPDYKLYLFEEQGIETEDLFNANKGNSHQIADVKQFEGFQTFEIPDDIDIDSIGSVVIWCERFSQYITYADVN